MYSLLKNELEKQGIKSQELDIFKLYNPDTYDKLITQARHSVNVAVKEYKHIIQISNKRR